MKTPYTFLEAEAIYQEYEEQIPLKAIANNINNEFHDGKDVRSAKSIQYVISRITSDDNWYKNLEENWLKTIKLIAN